MTTDPRPENLKALDGRLITLDGFRLQARLAIPPQARGVSVLCHGITADSSESGLFVQLEQTLTHAHIACVRFDFRGHGKSSGAARDVSLRGEFVDLNTVYDWIASFVDGPVFCIAASFSASAAVQAIQTRPCAGLVLINPIIDYAGIFIRGESEWGAAIVETYLRAPDAETEVVGHLPGSNYVVTARLLSEIDSDRTYDYVRNIRVPTLIFHGSADTLVPVRPVLELEKINPLIDVVIYENGRHGLKDFRPDILTRTKHWVSNHA